MVQSRGWNTDVHSTFFKLWFMLGFFLNYGRIKLTTKYFGQDRTTGIHSGTMESKMINALRRILSISEHSYHIPTIPIIPFISMNLLKRIENNMLKGQCQSAFAVIAKEATHSWVAWTTEMYWSQFWRLKLCYQDTSVALACRWTLSYCVLPWQTERVSVLSHFIRPLIPSWRPSLMASSKLGYFAKSPSPNTVIPGIRALPCEFGWGRHNVVHSSKCENIHGNFSRKRPWQQPNVHHQVNG